jgi:serine/threonine protein kinase
MIESGRFLQQRYRIDKQIGQGGMGAVYVATDERFGSTVAIKETLCMDDNFRKAIEREARLLNSLKHASLPRVSDHFEEDDSQFLVMEYIPGDDICCVMENNPHMFSTEKVVHWADQILDALDYLHNQTMPVIHRDIKPQNLKVTPRGDVILLDFGLAKGNPSDVNHQTAAKSIFGYSRNYASIEQIQGTGTDPRSDLYSLGATLYHVLTNTPPADALTRAMAVLSQRPDPLVPANSINPDVSAGVAGVLQRAMALNPDDRPASAAEMRQMFRESGKYAYLADAATASSISLAAIPVPTNVLPEHTRAAEMPFTDVKTAVMPANISDETSISPGTMAAGVASTEVQSVAPRRSRFGLMVATAAVVVMGCFGVAGLYVANPSIFGVAPQTQEPVKEVTVQPVANPANAAENSAVAGSSSDVAGEEQDPKTADQSKAAETVKNNKSSAASRARDNAGANDLPASDPDTGESTVRDGNGQTMTLRPPVPPQVHGQPPPDEFNPFSRGFDPNKFSQLTPAQRRKIREAIREAQRQQQQLQQLQAEPAPKKN